MNLTKSDKEAFINAVIADIPTVDYDEQIGKAARDYAISLLPKEIKDARKANPAVDDYLDTQSVYICGINVYVIGPGRVRSEINKNKDLQERCQSLEQLSDAQQARVLEMSRSLRAVINTCRTLKQAKERLPEFEKYLPAERDKTGVTNLPVANVIADLTRLGWPKGQQIAA